jgi:two-component system response regulator FixJ
MRQARSSAGQNGSQADRHAAAQMEQNGMPSQTSALQSPSLPVTVHDVEHGKQASGLDCEASEQTTTAAATVISPVEERPESWFGRKMTGEVFIVDDDEMVRDMLSAVLEQAGYRATSFGDGASFIAAARERIPACVILDIYMPGRSGLDLLKDLDAPNYPTPIFIASGRGDIPSAVKAIQSGAFDFIDKRLDADTLVARVRDAIAARSKLRHHGLGAESLPPVFPGCELLTPRQLEILALIATSATNQEAAMNLGISERTVEIHRAHILGKLGAKNSADLARRVINFILESGVLNADTK